MTTVTMRELKQNPHAVIQRILDDDEPAHITSHGNDTGVVLSPTADVAQPGLRFSSGAALMAAFAESPLTPAQAQAWKDDIANATDDWEVTDPWDDAL